MVNPSGVGSWQSLSQARLGRMNHETAVADEWHSPFHLLLQHPLNEID